MTIKMEKEMKLKVKIWRRKNAVIAEVISYCKGLTERGLICRMNGYEIRGSFYSRISLNTLSIKYGDGQKEDKPLVYAFNEVEEAIAWCNNIKAIINKINRDGKETPEQRFFEEVI